ncbi:signal transduction histidine kinase [Clostridium sartagoforme AAU1]|uniref:Signal transduction histidine kinase n=2 Tax=Clostridium sartagoforme TaxID=84031 RepID=R9CEJ7_9CLOT|nr:signal transduction histidine kinase [Clostridium sartagoforme AAU1]
MYNKTKKNYKNWDGGKFEAFKEISYIFILFHIIYIYYYNCNIFKYNLQIKKCFCSLYYRLQANILFIIFLMVILNISTYIFINKNVIKRLTVIKQNINESSLLEEENIINLEDDEINCIYDKVNALSNEANVTKKKLINTINNLKEEEKNYSNILNAMSNAFFSLKAIVNDKGEYIDGEITDVNLAGMELLGLSRKEIINNRFSNLYMNFYRDEEEIIQIFKRIKKSKSECIAREINIIDDKWGLVSVYSLSDGYFSIIINNITEIKKYEKT